MSVRFAHYSLTTPLTVVRYYAKGLRATDEMLLDAFQQIDPPLLGPQDSRAIAHILRRTSGRRPGSMPSGDLLAQKLLQCRRKDVPAAYVELLSSRLSKPKGLTEAGRANRAWTQLNKLQRDNMIRFLYAQFRDLRLDDDCVEHPILGPLLIPMNISSRSERALWLVREVMDERLGYYPPSEATIRNIISRKIK